MTSQHSPTRQPTSTAARQKGRGTGTAAPRDGGTQQPPDPRRSSRWLVWAGIAAALAAAVWLAVASMVTDHDAVPSARANQASTARLQGLADQYEAVRSARANQAATARLQGLADRYHPTP